MDNGIREIYPTRIVQKYIDVTEEELLETENYLKLQHMIWCSDPTRSANDCHQGNEQILDTPNIAVDCPSIIKITEIIRQSFLDLAHMTQASNAFDEESDPDNLMLDCKITNSKINLVKPGTRMRMHTHYYDDAYACLYFTDTEDGDGGELVLHDPRWQKNYFFAGRADVLVPSKRGLLVVAPSFLWHEVLEYHGRKDRWTYVVHGTIERVK